MTFKLNLSDRVVCAKPDTSDQALTTGADDVPSISTRNPERFPALHASKRDKDDRFLNGAISPVSVHLDTPQQRRVAG